MNILLMINKSKEHFFNALNMPFKQNPWETKIPTVAMLYTMDHLNKLNTRELEDLIKALEDKGLFSESYFNIKNDYLYKLRILAKLFNKDPCRFNAEYGLDKYICFSFVYREYHYENVRDMLAILKIQRAWRECRYNPKYSMCHKIQIQLMIDDGYEFSN